ncbi:hypothetical protein IYX23_18895 [Methylocystis sp. L43]|uniref:hypothetical protein n=1 Tax=unclassified Methylocystis TaxID=2625913 RepID=UPI0018C274C9|nr:MULTISPECIES: hypothetical protein [unclassified Methylocystis]MBG0799739.1 hypothetical protein [Methylocystis sp. L43]MBG0807522.1 hypothetical protein [Methylocystis sp. H15]
MPKTPDHKQRCIFCDVIYTPENKRSGEHIWPEWMHPLLSGKRKSHMGSKIKGRRDIQNRKVFIWPSSKKRAGDPVSKRMNVVCSGCNSGWMSRTESSVKPILSRMILGTPCIITEDEQTILARWSTLKAIIAEFDDTEHMAISGSDRNMFYQKQEPPPKFKIWIGYYMGNDLLPTYYNHQGIQVTKKGSSIPFSESPMFNTQATTIICGKFYLYLVSSSFEGFEISFQGFVSLQMRRIWPALDRVIEWPIVPEMNDDDARLVSNSLMPSLIKNG